MRIVHSDEIIGAVEALCIQACRQLPGDVASAMHCAANQEPFAPARMILSQLVENAEAAAQNQMPICQDTGMAWVMVELGQEVHLEGMLLKDAVDEGVRRGYTKGYLRKSVVADPLRRVNTLDNTPALLHVEMVPGDAVTITLAPKGFGSENMSGLKMLTPSAGAKGVRILSWIRCVGPAAIPVRPSWWAWASAAVLTGWRFWRKKRCCCRWISPTQILIMRRWNRNCYRVSTNWALGLRGLEDGPRH